LDDCNTQGTSPPTLEDIEKKLKDIKEAANFEFNEEDINQVNWVISNYISISMHYFWENCIDVGRKGAIPEDSLQLRHAQESTDEGKRRSPTKVCRKFIINQKLDIDFCVDDLNRGEEEETERITKELAELEERADELSKRSLSTTLSSISFINERNRKRNVERAEEAILEEIRASGGQKTEDPFTRRSTRPGKSGSYRPNADGMPPVAEVLSVPAIKLESASQSANAHNESRPDSKYKTKPLVAKPKTSDLFSAHDFDIKIDLEVPLPCKF
jgi:RNA polymerase-associated protein RTF1